MGIKTKPYDFLIKNKYLISILAAIISAFLYAWSIKVFINPSGLLSGGVMGISLIISRILETFFDFYIGPGTLLTLINTPLAIFAYFTIGKRFTLMTYLQVISVTFFLSVLPDNIVLSNDLMLDAIFGAIITGFATYIALAAEISTGGTDFVALYFSNKKGISTWNYVFALNAIILVISGVLFGWEGAMYSIIYQFVATQMVSHFHVRYKKVMLFIITANSELVTEHLITNHRRGITVFKGVGAYTKAEKDMLYMITSKDEANHVIELIREVDPNAFINVTKSEKIIGNFYNRPIS